MATPLITVQFKDIKEEEMISFHRMIFFYLVGRLTRFEVDDDLQANPNTMTVVNCIAEQQKNAGMVLRFEGVRANYIINCINFLPQFIADKVRPLAVASAITEMNIYMSGIQLDKRPFNATEITFFDIK